MEIKRCREEGVAVFEIVDPDAVLELVVRRKNKNICKRSSGVTIPPKAGVVSLDKSFIAAGATAIAPTLDEKKPAVTSKKINSSISNKKRKYCDKSTETNPGITIPPKATANVTAAAAATAAATVFTNLSDETNAAKQSQEKETIFNKNRKACDRIFDNADIGEYSSHTVERPKSGARCQIIMGANSSTKAVFGDAEMDKLASSNRDDLKDVTDQKNCASAADSAFTLENLSKAGAASALTTLAEEGICTKKDSLHDKKWIEQYNKLVAYRIEHGTCKIAKGTNYNNLQRWITTQRKEFREGHLCERRVSKLKYIGVFSVDEVQNYKRSKKESPYEARMRTNWELRFRDLVIFKLKHGNCIVSEQKDLLLSRWVQFQRAEYKRGNMSADRIAKLNEVGMLTQTRPKKKVKTPKTVLRWNTLYDELVAHKNTTGSCKVSRAVNAKLSNWAYKQVCDWRKGVVSEERLVKLREVGLLTEYQEARDDTDPQLGWNHQYNELLKYKLRYGDCDVPPKWEENQTLAEWCQNQRYRHKYGRLSDERLNKLSEIGFDLEWKGKDETMWNFHYNELLEYKRMFGDCKVPSTWERNLNLAKWVRRQRDRNKLGIISDEQFAKLSEIGFVWNIHEDKWNMRFAELMNFKEENGHCLVPKDYELEQLVDWVGQLRSRFKSGTIRTERIAQLKDIGFVFEVQDTMLKAKEDHPTF
jgi:hypothetical protein